MTSNVITLPARWMRDRLPHKEISRNQADFSVRVDYNLRNIRKSWIDYFIDLLENLYKSIVLSRPEDSNIHDEIWFRVKNEMERCNVVECRDIIRRIESYLLSPFVQESVDRDFYANLIALAQKRIQSQSHLNQVK